MLNLLKKMVLDAKEMGKVVLAIPVGNEFIVLGRPVDVLGYDIRTVVAQEGIGDFYRRSASEGHDTYWDRCHILSDSMLEVGGESPMSDVVKIKLVFTEQASSVDDLMSLTAGRVFHVDPSRCIVVE